MNNNLLLILSIVVGFLGLIGAVWALWNLRKLNILRKNFFSGQNARDLESVINELAEGLHTLQKNQVILESYIKNLRSDYGLAIQKVSMVKFNPFSDGGGNLSFVIAMLDGRNTGMVITSMHGREQNRIYTKQIFEGKCEIQLTDEELKAIEIANNQHKKLMSK
jgi:uncharacterized iron-regulated membrane protein